MSLEVCLPPSLRRPETRFTSISDGISGAEVYRVDADGRAFVLKIAPANEDPASWRRALEIRRRAAAAGLTPEPIHVDETRRAILTDLIVDRSFAAFYRDPSSHERALIQLARTIRRVHALPLPDDAQRAAAPVLSRLLATSWGGLTAERIAVPDFVRGAAEDALRESPPEAGHPVVLSHNDVHPKNVVHDGVNLYFMDWDAAGPNEPFFDLATIAVFLGMDGATCRRLLSAYEDAPAAPLPARFLYDRRLIAALFAVGFLHLGYKSGYTAGADAASGQTLEATPTLAQFYGQLRAGTLSLATGEGRWAYGLALGRESLTPVA